MMKTKRPINLEKIKEIAYSFEDDIMNYVGSIVVLELMDDYLKNIDDLMLKNLIMLAYDVWIERDDLDLTTIAGAICNMYADHKKEILTEKELLSSKVLLERYYDVWKTLYQD